MLAPLAPGAALVTVLDGHPAAHSWLGGVRGSGWCRWVRPFRPERRYSRSYREYGLDKDAILDACAQALLG